MEPPAGSSSVQPSASDTGTDEAPQSRADWKRREAKAHAGNKTYIFATKIHHNQVGEYSFRYPVEWKLRTQQTVSRLTGPDSRLVISFGLGPPGGLPIAYDEFMALLDESYSDVTVDNVDTTKVDDSLGVVIRGKATGSAGIRWRFLATVLERPNNQRAIGALAATDVDFGKFPPVVSEVLASFRPI